MRGPALPLLLALAAPLSALAEDRPAAEVDAELLLFLAEFADAEGEVPELGLLERAQAEAESPGAAASAPAADADRRSEPAHAAASASSASSSARPTPPEAEAAATERPRGDHR